MKHLKHRYIGKQKEFKEYDDVISIRLCDQFYRLCKMFSYNNASFLIRQLIRADINNDYFLSIDLKDYAKVNRLFTLYDIKHISNFTFTNKKTKKLNIKLFKEEKIEIKNRSNGNINGYIDLLFMDFINYIYKDYENKDVI